jgi:hypothetical protein
VTLPLWAHLGQFHLSPRTAGRAAIVTDQEQDSVSVVVRVAIKWMYEGSLGVLRTRNDPPRTIELTWGDGPTKREIGIYGSRNVGSSCVQAKEEVRLREAGLSEARVWEERRMLAVA